MSSQPPAHDHNEYVLGTGRAELDRLGLQHRLWSDAAHAAWLRAGVRLGHRVLDIGCGPGYAAFDLAQLVGPGGLVFGVDESPRFVAHVNQQAAARGLTRCAAAVGDVQHLASLAPPDALAPLAGTLAHSFDLAYARWVLCFVKQPDAVIAGAAALLRPGGRLVVHDYFNYRAMTAAPRSPAHDKAVAATVASWHARGGDTDVMGRLPRILADHGFTLAHLAVHQRIARPGDTMFHWPDVWWRTYAPRLVELGYLEQPDADELIAEMDRIARSTTDFIMCPPVFEAIAVAP